MIRGILGMVAVVLCFTAGMLCAADGEAWKAFGLATVAGANACWLAFDRGRNA